MDAIGVMQNNETLSVLVVAGLAGIELDKAVDHLRV